MADFHVVITPKGWTPTDEHGKARLKGEIQVVHEGGPGLTVGKTRTFGVWQKSQQGYVVPAFATLQQAGAEGFTVEVKGYTQDGGQGQYGPITYYTVVKARRFEGALPTASRQTRQEAPGGHGNGSGMSDDDRRRIVACWALKRAQVQVGSGSADKDLGHAIAEWASWYAEEAYRLAVYIALNEGTWKQAVAPTDPPDDATGTDGGGDWESPPGGDEGSGIAEAGGSSTW